MLIAFSKITNTNFVNKYLKIWNKIMKSIITTIVDKADDKGHFLSDTDIETIREEMEKVVSCFDGIEKLSAMVDKVTQESGDACFKKYPSLKKPGHAGDTPYKKQQCYRDIGHYIRLINYCLIVGTTEPLDKWGINGIREFYRSLDMPITPLIEGVIYARNYLCESNLFSEKVTQELRKYFDHAINKLG